MDNHEAEKTSAYDARFAESLGGEEYDDLLLALDFYQEFEAEAGKVLQEYIQKHCDGVENIRVLEAGPGTGITTLEILKADPRVHVVAVDNEPKMLEVVKNKFLAAEDFKNRSEFVLSDILGYLESCPDASFDAFVSVYTLHNFTPEFRKKVIEAISRKLKSGGVFINGDKYARDEETHKSDLAGELRNYDKFDGEALKAEQSGDIERAEHFRKIKKEWTEHMWEDEKNKISVEEQEEMFKELGFGEVEWLKRFDLVVTVKAVKK